MMSDERTAAETIVEEYFKRHPGEMPADYDNLWNEDPDQERMALEALGPEILEYLALAEVLSDELCENLTDEQVELFEELDAAYSNYKFALASAVFKLGIVVGKKSAEAGGVGR